VYLCRFLYSVSVTARCYRTLFHPRLTRRERERSACAETRSAFFATRDQPQTYAAHAQQRLRELYIILRQSDRPCTPSRLVLIADNQCSLFECESMRHMSPPNLMTTRPRLALRALALPTYLESLSSAPDHPLRSPANCVPGGGADEDVAQIADGADAAQLFVGDADGELLLEVS